MDLKDLEYAGKAINSLGHLAETFEQNQAGANLVVDLVKVVMTGVVATAIVIIPFIIMAFLRERHHQVPAGQPS